MSYWHRDRQDPALKPEPWWSFQRPFSFAVILILVLGGCWTVWYFLFSSAAEDIYRDDTLVLKTPPGPFSIRPDDYGRPVVPHQEKVLYDQFGQIQEDLASTTLRQAEESAVMLDGFEEALAEEGGSEEVVALGDENIPLEEMSASEDPSGNLVLFSSEETCPPEQIVSGGEPLEKGRFWLQLSSLKTRELAQEEWDRLKREHKTVLRKYRPVIVRINLGTAIGEQYQIHIGYFPEQGAAKKLCEKFQSAGIGCLVSGE
ncbi:MAG: SPOR domain-containing protein [bacterium]|nr:SPOR domain-containing protein [bacterium]